MENFFHSMLVNKPIIPAGKYYLVVDVCWDDSVGLDSGYDDVLVRLFCDQAVTLKGEHDEDGRDILSAALKQSAQLAKNKQYRNYYRESDAEYGNHLYRVSDPKTNVGYYGFCYRRNDSTYATVEKLILKLTGLHYVTDPEDDFVEIPSGGDNIIVFRADEAFGSTGYGMSMSMKSRGMSDGEIVEKCRQAQKQPLTGDVTYQMLLMGTGGAMIFNNSDGDKAKKITIDIEGSENLRIEEGDTFLKKCITVEPNGRGHILLRCLSSTDNPSLACGF